MYVYAYFRVSDRKVDTTTFESSASTWFSTGDGVQLCKFGNLQRFHHFIVRPNFPNFQRSQLSKISKVLSHTKPSKRKLILFNPMFVLNLVELGTFGWLPMFISTYEVQHWRPSSMGSLSNEEGAIRSAFCNSRRSRLSCCFDDSGSYSKRAGVRCWDNRPYGPPRGSCWQQHNR